MNFFCNKLIKDGINTVFLILGYCTFHKEAIWVLWIIKIFKIISMIK